MNLYGCSTHTVAECHRADNTPGGVLPRQEFGILRSRMFGSPPSRATWERAAALFETERQPGQGHQLEVWPFDGAVHDVARTDTAFVHRDSLLSVSFLASIPTVAAADAAGQAAGRRFVDGGFAVLDPESNGETYQNFADASLTGWQRAYYGENYARLARVKRTYDPYGAFTFAQSIR